METVNYEQAMEVAIAEAELAAKAGEVPVGAVVILNDTIIAQAHNEREIRGDPTAHAEILALRTAATKQNSSRLDGAVLVSTLEPCPMCAGAALLARVEQIVFGCFDPKAGACGSLYNFAADPRLSHNCQVTGGVLEETCSKLLTEFFAERR